MMIMPAQERRAYFVRLKPYLAMSVALFACGIVIGVLIMERNPDVAGYLAKTLAKFIQGFRGMGPIELTAVIFFNNAVKTLIAILLGTLLGVVPTIFLLGNGVALGVAWMLSSGTRGPWLSLLSLLPHGIIELPAVFLGTSIGLMIGVAVFKQLTRRAEATLAAELSGALRYFSTVIAPLLLLAALVEVFITAALVGAR